MKRSNIIGLIIAITMVMFVASLTLGLVAADDTKEITVGAEKFKIPNGYEENKTIERNNTVIKTYVNGDKFISLTVHTGEDPITKITSHDEGAVEKNIAGKDGIFKPDSHKFTYVSEDKKSSIVAMCDSDQTLEEFLKLN